MNKRFCFRYIYTFIIGSCCNKNQVRRCQIGRSGINSSLYSGIITSSVCINNSIKHSFAISTRNTGSGCKLQSNIFAVRTMLHIRQCTRLDKQGTFGTFTDRIRIADFLIIDDNLIGSNLIIEINSGCQHFTGFFILSRRSLAHGFAKDKLHITISTRRQIVFRFRINISKINLRTINIARNKNRSTCIFLAFIVIFTGITYEDK